MSSSTTKNTKDFPQTNPYEVLGLELGASDAEISKTYRKKARTLHPDKLQNLSAVQQEAAAHQFQQLQEARVFLLEHPARKRYDAHLRSLRQQQEHQRARVQAQSDRRQTLLTQLHRQEQEAREQQQQQKRKAQSSSASTEHLQRQGKKLREEAAVAAQQKAEQQVRRLQIRLKWSRKKLGKSCSEHSISRLLSAYGTVKNVTMIGSKGNLALVTFASELSCDKVVKAFSDSETYRATYVSKDKQQASSSTVRDDAGDASSQPRPKPSLSTQRDGESVQDWKLRRDAERERLLRQMESTEEEGIAEQREGRPFPPPFPLDYTGSPLQQLERAEAELLKGIVDDAMVQKIKVL